LLLPCKQPALVLAVPHSTLPRATQGRLALQREDWLGVRL
jgi:hypothetical protein